MKLHRISDELTMITSVWGGDMSRRTEMEWFRNRMNHDWAEYSINRHHSFRFSLDLMFLLEQVDTPQVLLVHEYMEANA